MNKGTLVATGSIAELRQRAGLPEAAPLEDVFLHSVQAEAAGLPDQDLLAWLTGHDDGAPAGA